MKTITLRTTWFIKAPIEKVFNLITDFEKWPEYFPKVAASVRIMKREENNLEINTIVKSLGREFPIKMKIQILPGRGFISDNESFKFGTSGHEEFFLSEHPQGTLINYTYQVFIHKFWLRIIAKPLIKRFLFKYWEKAVIDKLRKRLEK